MKFLNFLVKPASGLCNLRCQYCFYEDEGNNRLQKKRGIMQPPVVDQLREQAFRCIDPGGTINFTFQGGEPTMAGLEYFHQFTAKIKERHPRNIKIALFNSNQWYPFGQNMGGIFPARGFSGRYFHRWV